MNKNENSPTLNKNKFIDISKKSFSHVKQNGNNKKKIFENTKNKSNYTSTNTVINLNNSKENSILCPSSSNKKKDNSNLVVEAKLDYIIENSKKLDEEVLKSLDEIFAILITQDKAFGSSIEKLKIFLNSILQSVLEKLLQQQDLIFKYDKIVEENQKLKKQKEAFEGQINKFQDKFKIEQLLTSGSTTMTTLDPSTHNFNLGKIKDTSNNNIVKELIKENSKLKELLLENQSDIFYLKEKEGKLIKLLLAVKEKGIDLETIFKETIVNDEKNDKKFTQFGKKKKIQKIFFKNAIDSDESNSISLPKDISHNKKNKIAKQKPEEEADVSILNDSDESSFNFIGKSEAPDTSAERLYKSVEKEKIIVNVKVGKKKENIKKKLKLNLENVKSSHSSSEENTFVPQNKIEDIEEEKKIKEIEQLKAWHKLMKDNKKIFV